MKTYSEKLLDPQWQKKRLEVLERFNFQCAGCKSKTNTLHVHHRYYVSKREPWNYPDFAYVCLCAKCHKEEQEQCADQPSDWEFFLDNGFSPESFYALDNVRCNQEIPHNLLTKLVCKAISKIKKPKGQNA
jgi:hypothetical protein